MGGIVGQAEQYGLPYKEARELPPADEFSFYAGITPGTMKRASEYPPGADALMDKLFAEEHALKGPKNHQEWDAFMDKDIAENPHHYR
jgi:hypothetical protein